MIQRKEVKTTKQKALIALGLITSVLTTTAILYGLWWLDQPPYGTRLEFGRIELFYTLAVEEEDALRLGQYLETEGWTESENGADADGENGWSWQLDKEAERFIVRMVVQDDFLEDPEFMITIKLLATEFSQIVFDGAEVEVQTCDESLTPHGRQLSMPIENPTNRSHEKEMDSTAVN